MNGFIEKYLSCFKLNLKVMQLALKNQWLDQAGFAESYDDVSDGYDQNWLIHLKPVTDLLLANIPETEPGRILDLGCGTGYTTEFLEKNYAGCDISAVDVSRGMLAKAAERCHQATLEQADILDFLQAQEDDSAAIIVSAWAIGYSKPAKIIQESARILKSGGALVFVVNYADTLKPVFQAFKRSMNRFPERVNLALWPNFPKNWEQIQQLLVKNGFDINWKHESAIPIRENINKDERILDWLLQTGVIAGFDTVLPLKEKNEVSDYFEQQLHKSEEPFEHHYIAVAGRIQK